MLKLNLKNIENLYLWHFLNFTEIEANQKFIDLLEIICDFKSDKVERIIYFLEKKLDVCINYYYEVSK